MSLIPQVPDDEAAQAAVPSREHRAGEHPTHMEGFYLGYVEDAPDGILYAEGSSDEEVELRVIIIVKPQRAG